MKRHAPLLRRLSLALLLIAVLPTGDPARAAATSYLGWVTNLADGTVSVIDLATSTVIATHDVGKKPRGIAGVPGDSIVAVTNSGSGTLSILGPTAGEMEVYNVGRKPYDVAVAFDGDGAAVTLLGRSELVTVTEDGVGAPATVPRKPWGIELSPRADWAAVACSRGGVVELIPTSELPIAKLVRTTIATGSKPINVAIEPRGKEVAVVDPVDGTITVINVKRLRVVDVIEVGGGPWDGAYNPANRNMAAVSLSKDNEVIVFHRNDQTRIPVGRKPLGVAFTPDGSLLLVANNRDHTVSVIDVATLTVVATIDVGRKPWDVAVTDLEGV